MNMVKQFDVFEITISGKTVADPFENGVIQGVFESARECKTVQGFYDGGDTYKVRFMPSFEGEYRYKVSGTAVEAVEGSFLVVKRDENQHGPVKTTPQGFFAYQDGTPYYPVGTTCYAWVHQSEKMRLQTVETLSHSPFNKIRMCVFPKHYVFNQIDPQLYPFPKTGDGDKDFDTSRFEPAFFQNIEKYIGILKDLGIQADLILFHPYDKWGFSELPANVNDRYLDYVMARFGAYSNVWWSLANEYDFMEKKTPEDWDHYGQYLKEKDAYGHLIGVHNAIKVYDPEKEWLTHISIQNQEIRQYSKMGREYRKKYPDKPVIFDEVGYEGTINAIWGSLPPRTFLWRCYEAVFAGAYVTHGETYYSEQEDLWWSHGGILKGKTPERLAFMRKLLEETPGNGLKAMDAVWDDTAVCAAQDPGYMLFYYGMYSPEMREFYKLEEDGDYRVELIDTWEMTIQDMGIWHGHFKLPMPGKEGMLVRVRKCGSEN